MHNDTAYFFLLLFSNLFLFFLSSLERLSWPTHILPIVVHKLVSGNLTSSAF